MSVVKNDRKVSAVLPARTKRFLRAVLPLILGLTLALTGLEYIRTRILIKLEEAALGTETQMVYESAGGQRVLCQDGQEEQLCYLAYEEAGSPPAILWLGNSQLPAINRYKQGDATAATLLHDELSKRNAYLVSLAQPNANLAEHGLIFGAVAQRYKPRLLVLPIFLDDIREQGVRPLVASFIKNPKVRAVVETTPMWHHLSPMLAASSADQTSASEGHTLQQRVEARVNAALVGSWPLWRQRVHLRGLIALTIHTVRNEALGINSQSKRKVNFGVYTEKMRILKAILEHAGNIGIRTLLYIPPYRQDIVGPYVEADYNRLKEDLARLAQEHDAHFVNLEHVVPGSQWGTVVDPIFGYKNHDFMHFTGDGHRQLAKALDKELRRMGF